jgi:hypothetical protein
LSPGAEELPESKEKKSAEDNLPKISKKKTVNVLRV